MQEAFEFIECELSKSISEWVHSDMDKGQVYTCPEVVNFMLNISGLSDDRKLDNVRVLEPACGEGEFVVAVAKQLISSAEKKPSIDQLQGRILAFELVEETLAVAKEKVTSYLLEQDYNQEEVTSLLENWFVNGDFLLARIDRTFTHIVGNPPYVRVENIPSRLLFEYRNRFSSMADRADLYIPFFERSLGLLDEGGRLCFICTDRWTKNTYGKHLRNIISSRYSLSAYIDLYGSDSFSSKVSTYPAITLIRNSERETSSIVCHNPEISKDTSHRISMFVEGLSSHIPKGAQLRQDIVDGEHPWLIVAPGAISLVRRLEKSLPTLEEANCRVHIGAATGNNKVFVVDSNSVDVEESRLLPVITAKELRGDTIKWGGRYIINTYDDDGVVNLDRYPKLKKYFEGYREVLSTRHVAKKSPRYWYKTIDRVYPERAFQKKLLIPDIKSEPIIFYDEGRYHPNNSIYFIVSDEWDLHALKAVLMSGVARLFIETYTTKVANGYLRFQAQHLRKIRIPKWDDIAEKIKIGLVQAGESGNRVQCSHYSALMYGLSDNDRMIVGETLK